MQNYNKLVREDKKQSWLEEVQ